MYNNIIQEIKTYRAQHAKLSDEEFKQQTIQLKQKLRQGTSVEQILPEAYSLVWHATVRVLQLYAFDVQLMGAIVLHKGQIAEMKTGEGKSLVAAFAAYVNALSGKGVHIVTVNDYLAKRDEQWIGEVLRFLGLTTAVISTSSSNEERKQAYAADVTYITNSELGFDYLRDHMALNLNEMVQRAFHYCIIDEVDSILIDEARTPLIISAPSKASNTPYQVAWQLAKFMQPNVHYELEEKGKQVILKEDGIKACEQALEVTDIYSIQTPWAHLLMNAIKAKHFYLKDVHYLIKDEQVVIVDEFTGRILPGRRWADGLHQAVEAKEGVSIQEESTTLASITYQNLFLLYPKISGMTGTAKTEEEEFQNIYGLKVISIPTHRAMIRKDYADLVFRTAQSKWIAVAQECKRMWQIGRPVLVGTTSIEKSELLASLLDAEGVKYQLLNARPSLASEEASIIAQAGRKASVTIATNMAGRGTDIILGGNLKQAFLDWLKEQNEDGDLEVKWRQVMEQKAPEHLQQKYRALKQEYEEQHQQVVQLGGLYVIGTERHESRRIDNQLRGRSGRQGDPGSSRFFISLEDDLLRIFGGTQMSNLMNRLGIEEPLESQFLSTSLDRAQKKVENYYYQIRKQLFEYDQVLNSQRQAIYSERRQILSSHDMTDWSRNYLQHQWPAKLLGVMNKRMASTQVHISYDVKKMQMESVQPGLMNELERLLLLQQMDQSWSKHLREMSLLREFIAWRGYAQRDPLVEYKNEAYNLFIKMIEEVRQGYCYSLFRSQA
nr:preprotein translocase subunit SecA [Cyanidioschyzonaceae sp. 2]